MSPLIEDKKLRVSVPSGKGGIRVDRFLSETLSDVSRSRLQGVILAGGVQVNGQPVTESKYKIRDGDVVDVDFPPVLPSEVIAQDIPLDVVYEDDDLIVINKPVGLVVHPAAGNPDNTLVNALLSHCGDSLSGVGGVARPGIVHRLDKGTSGLMVAAKNSVSHASLSEQFAAHSIKRAYKALVWGAPSPLQGTVTGNIGRNPGNRKKMAIVSRGGKHAVTHYRVERTFGTAVALVECRLETGRTHQIRVHLSSLGHPLIGDPQYGGGSKRARHLDRECLDILRSYDHQALHACLLGFRHPTREEQMVWQAAPPPDFSELITQLESL